MPSVAVLVTRLRLLARWDRKSGSAPDGSRVVFTSREPGRPSLAEGTERARVCREPSDASLL